MKIEVVSGKDPAAEVLRRMDPPGFEVFTADILIVLAAQSDDRALQRRRGNVLIGVDRLEIRAQNRHYQLEQLLVLKHLFRRSVEPTQLLHKLIVRQVVIRRISIGYMGRLPSRNKHRERTNSVFGLQLPRHFKTDRRAHAVPKKRKWLFLKQRQQTVVDGLGRLRQIGERLFSHA